MKTFCSEIFFSLSSIRAAQKLQLSDTFLSRSHFSTNFATDFVGRLSGGVNRLLKRAARLSLTFLAALLVGCMLRPAPETISFQQRNAILFEELKQTKAILFSAAPAARGQMVSGQLVAPYFSPPDFPPTGSSPSEFLKYLASRLSLKNYGERYRVGEITIICSAAPLAYSSSSREVLLSNGLIRQLHNEAELAFVAAHEIAHQSLKHYALLDSGLSTKERQQLELDADSQALGVVAFAGYDPNFAAQAVLVSHGGAALQTKEEFDYPDASKRYQKLREQIRSSGWQPPGTINRRDFSSFKNFVLRASCTD